MIWLSNVVGIREKCLLRSNFFLAVRSHLPFYHIPVVSMYPVRRALIRISVMVRVSTTQNVKYNH